MNSIAKVLKNATRKIRRFILVKILKKEEYLSVGAVQNIIPVKKIFEDGIFYLGNNLYSKTFRFTDINYQVASENEQSNLFIKYSELLNSFDEGIYSKITINNRKINKVDFKKKILLEKQEDGLDTYREEYNEMLSNELKKSNEVVQEKLVTIGVFSKNIDEARVSLNREGKELEKHFLKIGSRFEELSLDERLRLLYDFYKSGEEEGFNFDFKEA